MVVDAVILFGDEAEEFCRIESQNIRNSKRIAGKEVMNIGATLIRAKERLAHGRFLQFVRDDCGFSPSSAENYMNIYRVFEPLVGENHGILVALRQQSLILLSRPSTPAAALDWVIKEASTGPVKHAEVQRAVAEAKNAPVSVSAPSEKNFSPITLPGTNPTETNPTPQTNAEIAGHQQTGQNPNRCDFEPTPEPIDVPLPLEYPGEPLPATTQVTENPPGQEPAPAEPRTPPTTPQTPPEQPALPEAHEPEAKPAKPLWVSKAAQERRERASAELTKLIDKIRGICRSKYERVAIWRDDTLPRLQEVLAATEAEAEEDVEPRGRKTNEEKAAEPLSQPPKRGRGRPPNPKAEAEAPKPKRVRPPLTATQRAAKNAARNASRKPRTEEEKAKRRVGYQPNAEVAPRHRSRHPLVKRNGAVMTATLSNDPVKEASLAVVAPATRN
jgi:hypothetical protein